MSRLEERLAKHREARNRQYKIIVGVMLAFVLVTGFSYYVFSRIFDRPVAAPSANSLFIAENKINVMVMGVDERGDDAGRSDTLFVLTADAKTRAVSMLSIPRDTRVRYPGYRGYDKINHAFAYGGPAMTQQLVESLLGVPMNYYVKINLAGFQKLVDAAGGVDIDVEKRMYYEDPWDDDGGLVIDLQPGLQRMDGKTAMHYVRYRDEEGDIGRIARQHKFMKAVLARLASPQVLPRLPAIIQEINSMVETNMPKSEMLRLASIVSDAYKIGIKTDMVPGTPAFINEVSYWLPDVVALRSHVAATLGVAMSEQTVTATRRDASEYQASIPKEMKIVERPKDPTDPTNPHLAERPNSPISPVVKPIGRIRVDILNASGSPEAPGKMATTLRSQGLEVGVVTTATAPQRGTVVIVNTNNGGVIGRLTSLPFAYALQVRPDDSKASQATVVVGRDFMGK